MANKGGTPENLRPPWPPGTTGNPAGYSRRRRLTDALVKALDEEGVEADLIRVGLSAAKQGDFRFWAYIFDRIDGKATDRPDEDAGDPSAQDDQAIRDYLAGFKEKPAAKPKPATKSKGKRADRKRKG